MVETPDTEVTNLPLGPGLLLLPKRTVYGPTSRFDYPTPGLHRRRPNNTMTKKKKRNASERIFTLTLNSLKFLVF